MQNLFETNVDKFYEDGTNEAFPSHNCPSSITNKDAWNADVGVVTHIMLHIIHNEVIEYIVR